MPNHRSPRATSFLALLLPAAIATAGATARAQSIEFAEGRTTIELPLVMLGSGGLAGLPCVEVGLGKERLMFLLDTGFNAIAVHRPTAERLGLEARGFDVVAAFGGVAKTPVFRGPAVSFGGADLTAPFYYGLELQGFANGSGRELDGILGGQFFARCVVTIDYPQQKVTLVDQEAFEPPADLEPVRLDFGIGQPEIKASIDGGREYRYLLDTGAAPALLLNAPFVRRHELGRDAIRLWPGRVRGFVGQIECHLASLGTFAAGPLQAADVPVTLLGAGSTFDLGGDQRRAGVIGTGMLLDRRITFDYERRRLFVGPATRSPLAHGYSGIDLDWSDSEGPLVRHVLTGPDRNAVDLVAGDRLLLVDGTPLPPTALALHALLRERASVVLTVGRGNRRHEVTWARIGSLPRVTLAAK